MVGLEHWSCEAWGAGLGQPGAKMASGDLPAAPSACGEEEETEPGSLKWGWVRR